VAVQGEGCRRRFIFLSEGHEGQGWSRFSGELSKIMDFFTTMGVRPPSDSGTGLGFLEPPVEEVSLQTLFSRDRPGHAKATSP
jgi:hypothetical protein